MSRSLVLLLAAAATALAPGPLALAGSARCTQCGMVVDAKSRSTSRIVQGEKALMFCDVGDLLTYLNRSSAPPAGAEVRDYRSGEWISAERAFYVHSAAAFRTPMGWGIVAFESRKEAEAFGAPLDLAGARRAVR